MLPAARNKVAEVLVRPLSALALEIIAKTLRISDEFVFSTGARPLAAFSRFKRRLDEASGTSGWTLHDLRRSARSLMARAGTPSEHAERCLGHVLPGIEQLTTSTPIKVRCGAPTRCSPRSSSGSSTRRRRARSSK